MPFRTELLVKPDGRYLIYYSWPEAPDGDAAADGEEKSPAPPEQAPWSPETGPADV